MSMSQRDTHADVCVMCWHGHTIKDIMTHCKWSTHMDAPIAYISNKKLLER